MKDSNSAASRAEAKRLGLDRYFTGKPCKNGHISERKTKDCHCVECLRETSLKHRSTAKSKAYKAAWRREKYRKDANERLYSRTLSREWKKRNKERTRELNRLSRERNLEAFRARSKAYYRKNKDEFVARSNKRRAQKLNAMPSWVDKQAISEIYKEAKRLTDLTGIQYHVDHIVPLQGKIVCGLHVPWNLQILTKKENLEKHNKFDENVSDGIKHLNLLRS